MGDFEILKGVSFYSPGGNGSCKDARWGLADEDAHDSKTKTLYLKGETGCASEVDLAEAYFHSVTDCKEDEKLNI